MGGGKAARAGGREEVPNIVRILTRSGTISGDLRMAANRAAADISIHPELGSIDIWSVRALDKAWYRAAAPPQPASNGSSKGW